MLNCGERIPSAVAVAQSEKLCIGTVECPGLVPGQVAVFKCGERIPSAVAVAQMIEAFHAFRYDVIYRHFDGPSLGRSSLR